MLLNFQMKLPSEASVPALLRDWREDILNFFRHDAPKVLVILLGAYILIKLVRRFAQKSADLQIRKLPPGIRVQQVRTVTSVLTSVGVLAIVFVAVLMVLSVFNFNLAPMLASAGIAGLAIGFGAQTLVHDFINGFFILFENQYDIGDVVRIAGVQGRVENMTLRRTVLRDDDGTVHIIPNSQITVVSNMTRDWAQMSLRVIVAYEEPSDKIMRLLEQVGDDVRHDSMFEEDTFDVRVAGI